MARRRKWRASDILRERLRLPSPRWHEVVELPHGGGRTVGVQLQLPDECHVRVFRERKEWHYRFFTPKNPNEERALPCGPGATLKEAKAMARAAAKEGRWVT